MLGITNPHAFEIDTYMGYPIKDAFKGNIRFVEVVINRNGNANGICPTFFDGAINNFQELPLPNDKNMIDKILQYIKSFRQPVKVITSPTPALFIGNVKKSIIDLHKNKNICKFATLLKQFRQWLMQ